MNINWKWEWRVRSRNKVVHYWYVNWLEQLFCICVLKERTKRNRGSLKHLEWVRQCEAVGEIRKRKDNDCRSSTACRGITGKERSYGKNVIHALRALQRARGIICGSAQGRHEQQYKIDDKRGGVGCPHEKEKRKEKV